MTPIRLGERGLLIPADRHDERRIGGVGVLTFHIICTLQGVLLDDVMSRLFHEGRETNLVTVSTWWVLGNRSNTSTRSGT